MDRWLIAGSPQQCAERIATYADHGVISFQLVPATAAQHEQLRLLAEEVRPRLRQAGLESPVVTRWVRGHRAPLDRSPEQLVAATRRSDAGAPAQRCAAPATSP